MTEQHVTVDTTEQRVTVDMNEQHVIVDMTEQHVTVDITEQHVMRKPGGNYWMTAQDASFTILFTKNTLCRLIMRDTLSDMVSCFLKSRQQTYMTTINSVFAYVKSVVFLYKNSMN